ncbi:MAG: hypothetical protein ACLU9S_24045 [Oscillospiraceae bacterium]
MTVSLTALVQQYVLRNYELGVHSQRSPHEQELTQRLLMSTALPMKDENGGLYSTPPSSRALALYQRRRRRIHTPLASPSRGQNVGKLEAEG